MFASLQAAKKALVKKKAQEDAARLAKASAAEKAKIKAELAKKKKLAAAKAAKIAKAAAEARAAEVAAAKAAAKAAAEAAAKVAAEAAAKAASLASASGSTASPNKEAISKVGAVGAITSISGVVTFNQISESVAVIYSNGAEPSGDMVFAELGRNGFDKDVYVVSPGGKITIKNKDNTLHRIKATDDYNDISKNMVKLQPRQKRAVQVSWKADTVVEMRSNKGALSASYLANVPSGAFQVIELLVGKSSHGFSFAGFPSSADTATILIPNHDPIVISFALGGSQRIPLVKKGQQVGEVELELN